MIISHKYKFAFIAIPKTGTESFRSKLEPLSDIDGSNSMKSETYIHSTAINFRDFFKKNNWDWNTYFKFTIVRNPFATEVSQYFYIKRRIDEHDKLTEEQQTNLPESDKNSIHWYKKSFEEDIKDWFCRPIYRFDSSLLKYTHDEQGVGLLDFIGRFENLQQDFNTICDKIGITHQQLPHKNKSKHKHYTEYYDDETRKIVAEKYAKDIEYFGYKF